MKRRAFTLVELLVVIAIIGLLSSIAVVSMGGSRTKARDLKRKTDLKQLATAVELYFAKNDSYPSTSNAWWSTCNGWVGLKGVSGANGWIPNLAPEFMGQLPLDPVRGTNIGIMTGPSGAADVAQYCYIYRSNGTDYKIASHCAAESGPAGSSDPFYKGSSAWSCGDHHFAVYSPGAYGW
jgi:prepilin-type N-terminal cleavage/methylation domain-containing protein